MIDSPIKNLSLNSNCLESKGIKTLLDYIGKNSIKNLTKLALDYCSIDEEGLKHLMVILRYLPYL